MMTQTLDLHASQSMRTHPPMRWVMVIGVCAVPWIAPAAAAPPFWATDHVADRGFCRVTRTASGFAVLRARPNDAASFVARMAAGDEVMMKRSQKGRWLEVIWWRSQTRHLKGFDSYAGKGWVRREFVGRNCD